MNLLRFLHLCVIFLSLISTPLISTNSYAENISDARIDIALKLFRTTLSADQKILTKQKNNQLNLYILYQDNLFIGQKYSHKLLLLGRVKGKAKIKNLDLNVNSISYQQFLLHQHKMPAGIFLADKLSAKEVNPIVAYTIKNHIILFSPFEGDVEKSITAGLSIGAQVRPILNMQTLKASAIQLKSFFLKVAKKYEP
jgi:hypothetical protein